MNANIQRFLRLIRKNETLQIEKNKSYTLTSDGTMEEASNIVEDPSIDSKLVFTGSKGDVRALEIMERNISVLNDQKMDKSNVQPILDIIDSKGLASTLRYQMNVSVSGASVGKCIAATPSGFVVANTATIENTNVIGLVTGVEGGKPTVNKIGMTDISFNAPNGTILYLNVLGNLVSTRPTTGIIKKIGVVMNNKVIVEIDPAVKIVKDPVTTVPTAIRTNLNNKILEKLEINSFDSIQLNASIKGDNFAHSFILHIAQDGNGQDIEMNIVSDLFVGIDDAQRVSVSVKKIDAETIVVEAVNASSGEAIIGATAKVRRIVF